MVFQCKNLTIVEKIVGYLTDYVINEAYPAAFR